MKKLHISLILVALLVLCTLAFSSCQNNTLNKPSGVNLDVATQTLRWNMVKGAKFYTIEISGMEKAITTKSNYISLEDLKPGNYHIKVQANSGNEVYKDSAYATFQFTREVESGLKYQLINNATEFELIGGGSAEGEVVMESIYRGKPVTSIADKALYGNTRITKLVVGENVKTIGEKAFSKCARLTTVVIPENVKSIGRYAFQSCKALTHITLPESITTISANLFDWCSSLETLTVGKNIQSIGEYAFANCESLKKITYAGADHTTYSSALPDTLQTIDTFAFTECHALNSLSLGRNVTTIGASAFAQCSTLKSIYLGESLLTLGKSAFSLCTSLNGVRIPDSTTKLSDSIFVGCSALDDITLGKGLQTIGAYVFVGTKLFDDASLTDMLILDGWLIQYFDTTSENLIIDKDVHGIASYAFASNPTLTQASFKGVEYVGYAAFNQAGALYSVSFDDALLQIADYAFYYCEYLKNVALGNALQTVGSYAFQGCSRLESVDLPKTVTSVGTRAFRKTAAYTRLENSSAKGVLYMGDWAVDFVLGAAYSSVIINPGTHGIANYTFSEQQVLMVNIPDSVEYIGRGAFYNCSMYMVNLPSSLKSISDYAFYGCSMANFGGTFYDLVIPEGTEYVGRSAFYKCSNILSIEVPGTVKTIGPYAFYGCKAVGLSVPFQENTGETDENGNPIIKEVIVTGYIKLGEGIESIGERAFQSCESLRSIVIPDSVTYIGKRAFYKCNKLHTVTLGAGLEDISEYLFYKCENLENVTISSSLRNIGNYAFRGCVALKNFDFKQVENIGRYSFYGCTSLEKINIPDSVDTIGDYAFRGCTNATAILLPDTIVEIGKHAFYGLKSTTLYCESETIKPYWNSQFNSSFRPVFWGVTLSNDNSYVVSVVAGADSIVNPKATNGISDPIRDGYTFAGWTTEAGDDTPDYTSENVAEAPTGTILYAVWTQKP